MSCAVLFAIVVGHAAAFGDHDLGVGLGSFGSGDGLLTDATGGEATQLLLDTPLDVPRTGGSTQGSAAEPDQSLEHNTSDTSEPRAATARNGTDTASPSG